MAAREFDGGPREIRIFLGGDGTLSEGLQGMAEHFDFDLSGSAPVGFLPGGTGNSFLRDFGITSYEEGRNALLDALEEDSSLAIDAAELTYRALNESSPETEGPECRRVLFNIFGIGIISDITHLAVRMRYLGPANYQVATFWKILTQCSSHWKTRVDGTPENLQGNLITISNSRYTGGAMEIAPAVRVNDGRLFFVRVNARHRLSLFRLFPKILKGEHQGEPEVDTRFIQKFSLESESPFLMNVDGELETGFSPQLEVNPSFFRLYLDPERLE